MLLEQVDDCDSGIGTSHRRGRSSHRREPIGVVDQEVDLGRETVSVEFAVGNEHRSTCVNERPCVGGLVIPGRTR